MNRLQRVLAIIFAIAGLAVMTGCGRNHDDQAVVTIQKTTPSGDVPLVAGDSVTFEVDVRVQGLKSAGKLALIVQSAEGSLFAGCDPIAVTDGSTVRLSAAGVIPETARVRVFTPLYVGDDTKTDALDTRTFKVVGKVAQ